MNKADLPEPTRNKIISDKDYDDFVEMARGFIKSCEGNTSIMPNIAVVYRSKGDLGTLQYIIAGIALGAAWNDYSTRVKTLRDLATKLYSEGNMPMAVAMVAEAWASSIPIEDLDKPRTMPRDDPNRVEVAIVSSMTLDGRDNTSMAPITRDAEDRMTIGEFDVKDECKESILEHFFHQLAIDLGKKHGAKPESDYHNN